MVHTGYVKPSATMPAQQQRARGVSERCAATSWLSTRARAAASTAHAASSLRGLGAGLLRARRRAERSKCAAAWQRRCTRLPGRWPPSRGTAQPTVWARAPHRRPSRRGGRRQLRGGARSHRRGAAAAQGAARALGDASMSRTCAGRDGGRECCGGWVGPRRTITRHRAPSAGARRGRRISTVAGPRWATYTQALRPAAAAHARAAAAPCHGGRPRGCWPLGENVRATPTRASAPFSASHRAMAASSWDTYEASKALLAKHGSVAGVKAAAATDASVVKPLTVGLDKWSAIDAAIVEAAKDVDIVIPVRSGAQRRPHRARDGKGNAPRRKCRRFGSRLVRAVPRRRSATWTSWSSGATSCCPITSSSFRRARPFVVLARDLLAAQCGGNCAARARRGAPGVRFRQTTGARSRKPRASGTSGARTVLLVTGRASDAYARAGWRPV